MGRKKIICFQIGAREHYALPRGFFAEGRLEMLVTDFTYRQLSLPLRQLVHFSGNQSLQLRRHEELANAPVRSFSNASFLFESISRLRGLKGWELILARNKWFSKKASYWLEQYLSGTAERPIIFSYSYSAADIFKVARKYGCETILGQIDGAVAEEMIVKIESGQYPWFGETFATVPSEYWETWKEELALADRVVVNSSWSRQLAIKNGVPANKLHVVPLAYQQSGKGPNYLDNIRKNGYSQPLKVLYLGTLTLRKGIARLLEIARQLEGEPIEFSIAGSSSINIPVEYKQLRNVKWLGKVERDLTADLYKQHHVFIFPTLSDGFGLTQLEALENGCYLLASPYCGEVVAGEFGQIIDPYDPGSLIAKLQDLSKEASPLWQLRDPSPILDNFCLQKICSQYP